MASPPQGSPLIREVRRLDGAMVVVLTGEVDLNRSPDLLSHLSKLAAEKPAKLIVDLGQVSYMDSSGVGTLVHLHRQVKAYDGQLALVALQQWVRNLLEITRLDRFFSVYESEEEALEA